MEYDGSESGFLQRRYDFETILRFSGEDGSSHLKSALEGLINQISSFQSSSSPDILTPLKTLCCLIQVSSEAKVFIENDSLLVSCLNIALSFLRKSEKNFDITTCVLCDIVFHSLLLLSHNSFEQTCHHLVPICVNALTAFLHSESQQPNDFQPQIAAQLLTNVVKAATKKFSAPITSVQQSVNTESPCTSASCNIVSHNLVIQLALCNNDTLRAQTLIVLIPQLVQQEQTEDLLKDLLEVIVVCEEEEEINRALGAVCALCTYYLPDGKTSLSLSDYVKLSDSFWLLVQRGLCADMPLTRKHALYLIRKAIDSVSSCNSEVPGKYFFWSSELKEKLSNIWQNICTVLEVLEERAVHLVTPVLDMLENLLVLCLNDTDKRSSSSLLTWILTVFKRVLQHPCIHVAKWGVETLISQNGCDLIKGAHSELFLSYSLKALIKCLSLSQIFYDSDGDFQDDHTLPEISKKLVDFFICAALSEFRQEFFHELFNTMGELSWAPIPLFFITTALSKVPSFSCLKLTDVCSLRKLVCKITATQNVLIRTISLDHVFMTVTNIFDSVHLDINGVRYILQTFYNDSYLPRGCGIWDFIATWLRALCLKCNPTTWVSEFVSNTDQFSPVFSQLIILFLDTGYLNNLDCLQEKLLDFVSDCDSRPYVNQEAQTKCLELIAGMIETCECAKKNLSERCSDKATEALVPVIQRSIQDIIKLLKLRLFNFDDQSGYHNAQRLSKCLETMCKHEKISFLVFQDKAFDNLITTALDIVQNEDEREQMRYSFAMCVLRNVRRNEQALKFFEKIDQASEKILSSRELIHPHLSRNLRSTSWSSEVLGTSSSQLNEAQWELIDLYARKKFPFRKATAENQVCDASGFNEKAHLRNKIEEMALNIVQKLGVALDVGDRNILPILLDVLMIALPYYPKSVASPLPILRNLWACIKDVRHKDIFYSVLQLFLHAVFQPQVLFNTDWGADFAVECGQEIFAMGDSAANLVCELAVALRMLARETLKETLQSHLRSLVVSCLVFGPIPRRDERLLRKIILSASKDDLRSRKSDLFLRNDPPTFVRSVALDIIIALIETGETWREQIGDLLAQDLMKQTETTDAKRARYFANSLTHRIQQRVLQSLTLVELTTSMETREKLGRWLLNRLLTENHQLSVRYLTESLLVRITCTSLNLQADLWNLIEVGAVRESALCSVVCTLLHTSRSLHSQLELREDKKKARQELENFLSRFFVALIPLTMSQAYSVRFNSHIAILKVWEVIEELNFTDLTERFKIVASSVQTSFNLASNKFQNHNDFYLTEFRCFEHYSLETIFYQLPRLTLVSQDEWIKPEQFEIVGIGTSSQIRLSNHDRRLEYLSPPSTERKGANPSSNAVALTGCLQKKMVPSKWLDINEFLIKALPEPLQPGRKEKDCDFPISGLVVVASLLDKAYNLGGLSRTCEIMGASLVLPKMSYANDREFQALSMSSEMWASLSEVKPFELRTYLTEMKRRGFTLVGAEQTASSTSLSGFCFDENTVLLLGNEREGVPSNLLPLLDHCVEIPQYGLVRSLNVHVAGALFIYEYARQHSQRLSTQRWSPSSSPAF